MVTLLLMAIEPKDLQSFLQAANTKPHRVIYKSFDDVKDADFILCNTVRELESHTISAIQEKQPIYAIGPVFPSKFKRTASTSLRGEFDCSQWLNSKPQGSVLYVTFGSLIASSKSDIEEIAHGLVLSGVNFIWVLCHGAVSDEEPYVLPLGIKDEIKDKGLIVPLCNQVEVISNPAIGGLMTHCGWNLILKSVWCGLPLLCFPLLTDQPTNRKLVADGWRVGINLCDRKPLTRSEVAQKINELMLGKSAEELRKEIMKVLENALAIDGSSEKNFSQSIADVRAKIDKRHALVRHHKT